SHTLAVRAEHHSLVAYARILAFRSIDHDHALSGSAGRVSEAFAVRAEPQAMRADAIVGFSFFSIHYHKPVGAARGSESHVLAVRTEDQAFSHNASVISLAFLSIHFHSPGLAIVSSKRRSLAVRTKSHQTFSDEIELAAFFPTHEQPELLLLSCGAIH